jgi:formylglycine-generating enzyme required for sulfatase activity
MICPYCVEDIPANSQQHHGCREMGEKQFPPFYLDFHGGEGSAEPVVLSVVGFPGHGKTVYLCALFDYLDNHLTKMWRERRFFNHVLDQESLSRLNNNRRMLRNGELPPPTIGQSFPRPGIFRLTNMPHSAGSNGLPTLVDTTVLIYDPPGEAFHTEDSIVKIAGFVKRSSCVLFLIDLTALGESIADEMALLLDTYVLGMRRMGIGKRSQHLIVVYTKSDEMKVSVPAFADFLGQEPGLREYLDEERPATLSDTRAHLNQLEHISQLLETFTWSELNAGRFINVAQNWFASVSYTVVSSLGAAPEFVISGNGSAAGAATQGDDTDPLDLGDGTRNAAKRLTVRMSPRGVADPLLHVLAKSIKEPLRPPAGETTTTTAPPPGDVRPIWLLPALIVIAGVLGLVALLAWAWGGVAANQNVPVNGATNTRPNANSNTPAKRAAPKGMAYVPGGEFIMGSAGGDDFERPPHRVSVEPFFIDLYEVTRADYARFVEQTGHAPPPGWGGALPPAGTALLPVTNVSWDDAVAYAEWLSRRLPTEEEWEFAARGTDGRPYPWGREWQVGMANAGGSGGLAVVGSFKGASPFGAYDMVGNAWEWTASAPFAYPGGRAPASVPGEFRVIRGGSWSTPKEQATATYRGYLARGSGDTDKTGFRCAKDAAE